VLASDDVQLTRAIRFVREHACDPICVADVLQIIPLSRSTLENRFRQCLGRTIHAEIQRVQVEHARQLLVHTDLLIKQIANRCGFKYVPYLTRVFRQHVGLSPGEYRRHHRLSKETGA
jgi:LacI family transcriptional regulator